MIIAQVLLAAMIMFTINNSYLGNYSNTIGNDSLLYVIRPAKIGHVG